MTAPAPGWLPDPDARHEYRYWDGSGWTDDVADGGVTSTDPVVGDIPAPPSPPSLGGDPGAEPTTQIDTTEQFPTSPVPPTSQYPGPGATSLGSDSGQGPAQYPQYPAPTPPKKRPSTGLIAGLAVLAIALIGGGIWLLVRDDGDDSADDASEISDSGDASSEDGTSEETGDTSDDTSDDTSSDESDDSLPGGLDPENEDAIVDVIASTIEDLAGGEITHDQAVCVSQGFVDEFGLSELASGTEAFTDPGLQDQLMNIFEGCDVDPEALAGSFGG